MRKKILFSLIPAVGLLLIAEIGTRMLYFQVNADYPTGIQEVAKFVKNKLNGARLRELYKFRTSIEGAYVKLYGDEGKELRKQFCDQYEANFSRLVEASKKISTRLIVMYLPSRTKNEANEAEVFCRAYYKSLAAKYSLEYLDMTDKLYAYPLEQVSMMPVDMHLSRLGNQIVAGTLKEYLAGSKNHCSIEYEGGGRRYGDVPASKYRPTDSVPDLFKNQVFVNRQGFRMTADLEYPKKRMRILCLGDSFTYGMYLPNHDSFPEILGRSNPEWEVVNGGVGGYTICDEAELFIEKAQYVAPDITILQVLDNDVHGFYWFMLNEFARKKQEYQPTKLEKDFVDAIIEENRKAEASRVDKKGKE